MRPGGASIVTAIVDVLVGSGINSSPARGRARSQSVAPQRTIRGRAASAYAHTSVPTHSNAVRRFIRTSSVGTTMPLLGGGGIGRDPDSGRGRLRIAERLRPQRVEGLVARDLHLVERDGLTGRDLPHDSSPGGEPDRKQAPGPGPCRGHKRPVDTVTPFSVEDGSRCELAL